MQPLEKLSTQKSLLWRWDAVKGEKRLFELRSDDAPLARLRYERFTYNVARAELADARFTLKREGFLRQRLIVRGDGSHRPLAEFRLGMMKGEAELSSGSRFILRSEGLGGTRWQWETMAEAVVMRFVFGAWSMYQLDVTPVAGALGLPELPLLTALGFYALVYVRKVQASH